MAPRRFEDLPVGTPFHFASPDQDELATYVKIDPRRARSQAGGALIEAPPFALVRPIGL